VSGFVALLHQDGRPVEQDIIGRLVAAMEYRGPDGASTRLMGAVALGHAAFHTVDDPTEAVQPLSLDERLWIVADARIDDRTTLVARLAAAGRDDLEQAPDAVLLLHAYDVWGDAMVDKLLGDFAFAIWDVTERRLFCARDHMGVKPLYYATAGDMLLVGNTIQSLRAHPQISDDLDDHAIGDYLLFGLNRHAERTSFADIRRLPPAHRLSWQPGASRDIRRFWRLAVDTPLDPMSEHDCVARFDELFRAAVADRVRGDRAAVLMSGGLDSTSVAAVAHEIMKERYAAPQLTACTFVHERLTEDPERGYSRGVAEALGIPIHQLPLDDDLADDLWGPTAAWSAEPNELPASARMVRLVSQAAPGTRVGFTGHGGDPALHVTPTDAAHRASIDGWPRTLGAMLRHRARHGSLPRVGLRTHLKRTLRGRRYEFEPIFPPWLNRGFVERAELRERHRSLTRPELNTDTLRPEAVRQLDGPEWSFYLEWFDPGMTGFLAEYRHPLLDVRLLEFALRLPMIPWLVEKEILRRTMRGRLPEEVTRRRKAPLQGFPLHQALIASGEATLGLAFDNCSLAEFVDTARLAAIVGKPERLRAAEYALITRPLGLALWLSRLKAETPGETEVADGPSQQDGATKAVS